MSLGVRKYFNCSSSYQAASNTTRSPTGLFFTNLSIATPPTPSSNRRWKGKRAGRFLPPPARSGRPAAAQTRSSRPNLSGRNESPSSPQPPFLFVSGDFAPDLLPATMEDKITKSPGCVSKGDPPSLPSLSEAPPAVKMSPPVEGLAWRRPPPSHIPPPPAYQKKPKSS